MTHALPAGAPGAARRTAWRAELRAMLALALPVTLSQVGLMLMGVVDTMMVGHLSAAALAATALGTVYFYAFVAFGQGVLFALDPVVSQAVGAGDRDAVAHAVQRGLVLALALAVPIALLMLPAPWILARLGQPAEVWPTAAAFARASAPGVVPYLGFTVLRQTLQAQHRTRAVVWAIVVGNLVNLALNWVFIYGRLGAPALGAVGSAWSSTVGRWVMAGTLAALGWPHLRAAVRPWRAGAWRPAAVARLARLGLPIGVQQALEYGAFGTVGLVMGGLGTVAMAGHQATLNLASLTFMVPLGVSAAAAVRVGHAVGAGDAPRARRAAAAGLLVGVGFMAASALVLLALPRALAGLYTDDAAVLALAASLIPIAGVFQVFDGLQVVSLGVLRGVGDTRGPMLINLVGFWLVGLPAGAWLCFGRGLGARGLWWGLVVGLATVSVVLAARVRRRLAGRLARTVA
jgi:MATE family multidrug resistance protein